jgi:hypothetical protein
VTFNSLLKGDLLEGTVSAAIIVRVDDVERLANIKRHRKSFEELVRLAFEDPRLARGLEVLVRQLQEQLGKISGYLLQDRSKSRLLEEWKKEFRLIDQAIGRYTKRLQDLKLLNRHGAEWLARKNGRSLGQWLGDGATKLRPATVNKVVDMLAAAGERGGQLGQEADDTMVLMALSDVWLVTAPLHRSDSDATRHITVLIDGIDGQVHLQCSKSGHLFQITTKEADASSGSLSGFHKFRGPGQ